MPRLSKRGVYTLDGVLYKDGRRVTKINGKRIPSAVPSPPFNPTINTRPAHADAHEKKESANSSVTTADVANKPSPVHAPSSTTPVMYITIPSDDEDVKPQRHVARHHSVIVCISDDEDDIESKTRVKKDGLIEVDTKVVGQHNRSTSKRAKREDNGGRDLFGRDAGPPLPFTALHKRPGLPNAMAEVLKDPVMAGTVKEFLDILVAQDGRQFVDSVLEDAVVDVPSLHAIAEKGASRNVSKPTSEHLAALLDNDSTYPFTDADIAFLATDASKKNLGLLHSKLEVVRAGLEHVVARADIILAEVLPPTASGGRKTRVRMDQTASREERTFSLAKLAGIHAHSTRFVPEAVVGAIDKSINVVVIRSHPLSADAAKLPLDIMQRVTSASLRFARTILGARVSDPVAVVLYVWECKKGLPHGEPQEYIGGLENPNFEAECQLREFFSALNGLDTHMLFVEDGAAGTELESWQSLQQSLGSFPIHVAILYDVEQIVAQHFTRESQCFLIKSRADPKKVYLLTTLCEAVGTSQNIRVTPQALWLVNKL